MVVLCLGSNIGDRLAHLRQALAFLKKIPAFRVSQVSPVYISDALLPDDAPLTWDAPFLNVGLRCETELTPYELLQQTKHIETLVGRKPEKLWGPRVIDIDILAWDDLIQYDEKLHIPHESLHERPFALWPLADVAPRWIYPLQGIFYGKTAEEMAEQWGSRFSGSAPLHTRQIQQRIDTPQIVGIVNLTPDSFSGDGEYLNVDSTLVKIKNFINDGAEIIDIGAEGTGPAAKALTARDELLRLEPLVNALIPELKTLTIPPKISIDTRHVFTARRMLELGVDWINDVSGLDDRAMQECIAQSQCDVVVMHNLGIPVSHGKLLPRENDPVNAIYAWAEKKIATLEHAGILRERIIFDVGIGYGNSPEQALELIKFIQRFTALGTRLLVGHSRKSFLQQFTVKTPGERDIETFVLSLYLKLQQVDYLRVHNVDQTARGFKVAGAVFSLSC